MSYEPPPPSKSSNAPQSAGAYTPPPPSPQRMAPAGGNPSNLAHLPQSYIKSVTRPNVDTYTEEAWNASWTKTLIGITASALVGALTSFLDTPATYARIEELVTRARTQDADFIIPYLDFLRGVVAVSPFLAMILTFVGFFLGVAAQYLAARTIGNAHGSSFMVQANLASLSYTPLRLATAILGLLSFGSCLTIWLFIYQIYCVGTSMQAMYRMTRGKAQLSAFSPLILGAIFFVPRLALDILGYAGLRQKIRLPNR